MARLQAELTNRSKEAVKAAEAAACAKFRLKPHTFPANALSALISNTIYTPVMSVVMVLIMVGSANAGIQNGIDALTKQIGAASSELSEVQTELSQGNDIKTLSPNGLQESYIWPSLSPAGDKVLYYVCGVGAFVCDLSGNIVARLGALRAPQWYGNSVVVGMNDRDDGHTVVASSIVATTLTGENQTLTPDSLIAMFPQTCERAGRIAFTTADGELYMIQLEK